MNATFTVGTLNVTIRQIYANEYYVTLSNGQMGIIRQGIGNTYLYTGADGIVRMAVKR